jgi:hypothetical protein
MFEIGEYVLYEMNTHSAVDRSKQEIDIINTIGEFYGENLGYRFMVMYYDPITTEPKMFSIRNIGDYEAYIQEYNTRQLKNKTCMQLKKEILDIKGVEAPKTIKLTKPFNNSKI